MARWTGDRPVEKQIGQATEPALQRPMGVWFLAYDDSMLVHDGIKGRDALAIEIGIHTTEMV